MKNKTVEVVSAGIQVRAPRVADAPPPDRASFPRTFVVSDAHGYPEVILNALDHGGFRPGVDGFVYAGDLVDRGPDPKGCLDIVDRYATEVLVGNHELAAIVGFEILDQTPASLRLQGALRERVLDADPTRVWRAATVVGEVLVSHGGVSSACAGRLEGLLEDAPGAVALAARLNREFETAIRRELDSGEYHVDGVLAADGPLWFRPRPYSPRLPAPGLAQVVGHSPPVPELEAHGFHMVDPCVSMARDPRSRFRYAVIEGGVVRVEWGDSRAGRADVRAATGGVGSVRAA